MYALRYCITLEGILRRWCRVVWLHDIKKKRLNIWYFPMGDTFGEYVQIMLGVDTVFES